MTTHSTDSKNFENRTQKIEGKVKALQEQVVTLRDMHRTNGSVNTKTISKVTMLEKELDTLKASVARIESRIALFGDHAGPVQNDAIMAEINRVDERSDALWADINRQLSELMGRVDTHETRLNDHDQQFEEITSTLSLHGPEIARAHDLLETHTTEINEIKNNPVASNAASAVPLVIGLVVGIIAFIFVDASSNRSVWWELGIALALASITAAVASVFVKSKQAKSKSKDKNKNDSSKKSEEVRTTSNNRSSAPANDLDQTRQMPVGTHDDQAHARS